MSYFKEQNGGLVFQRRLETLWLMPWGENSLRVRATQRQEFTANDWALTEPVPDCKAEITIDETGAKSPTES